MQRLQDETHLGDVNEVNERNTQEPTWRQVLGEAAGVHQNISLKGGVKVVICTEEGQEVTSDDRRRAPGLRSGVLPVVEQDVRRPDLIRGEAEVFHSWVFALVPLEVVVKPTL